MPARNVGRSLLSLALATSAVVVGAGACSGDTGVTPTSAQPTTAFPSTGSQLLPVTAASVIATPPQETDQVMALVSGMDSLIDRWNENQIQWIAAFQDPNVSLSEFLQVQSDVEQAQFAIVTELALAVEQLPTTELRGAFAPLSQHYANRLDSLRSLFRAATSGTEQEFNDALASYQVAADPRSTLAVLEMVFGHDALAPIFESQGVDAAELIDAFRTAIG